MEHLTAEINFVLLVGGLIVVLTLVNVAARFQSKRRSQKLSFKKTTTARTQAKVVILPVSKASISKGKVEKVTTEELI